MTYTVKNYKTAKELKADFTAGVMIKVFEPGPFPLSYNGVVYLEGPHYPQPHRWYLAAKLRDGVISEILKG